MEEEEITKEIKNISEIDTSPLEPIEEEKPTTKEPPIKEKKSKKKKKIWIIGGIIAGILLILTILILILFSNDKEEDSDKKSTKSNDSKFVTLLKEALKSGELDKAINEGLTENDIQVDSVCILRMDIDSDGEEGLVVYAEGNKKILLQLNTNAIISYEDSFLLDSKESLGYGYSSEKNENYWYTEFEKNYTIISSAKKIIKEDDFANNYYTITKTYQQKPILNHCMEYKFDKELDAKIIEKNTIKTEDVLKDNQIKKEEIKEAYTKYITEKKEKEQQEKEEAEKQAKEEELKRKLSGSFTLGDISYHYGSYKLTIEEKEEGTMILYSDGTCTYNETACKYQIGDVRNEEDELVPGITLNNGKIFISSPEDSELIEPKEKIIAHYNS